MRPSTQILKKASLLKSLPWGVLAPAILMTMVGVAFIYSATTDFELTGQGLAHSGDYHVKQIAYAVAAIALLIALALTPTSWLSRPWPLWIAAGLTMLGAVMVFGRTINGAKSWIPLGPVNLQPSEMCKPLLIVALAGFLRFHRQIDSPRTLFMCLGITGLFFFPILLQPDFGTAMVFVPVVASMVWVAGGNRLYMAAIGAMGAFALPVAYLGGFMKAHQSKRIDIFLSSLTGEIADQSGDGYQLVQSMTAVGGGGVFGQGYGQGAQSQLSFLPERHTDFIFSVIAEETGLIGVAVFLLIFFWMLWQMLAVARNTREPYARLVCVGVAAMFFAQLVINVGMTCGVMPITGLTLPFVSYGGSSLWTAFVSLGLVANVAVQPERVMGKTPF
ncbi:MAG: rod shape-determining protein RodA [Planctomycetes bacterium]|nr:rod shape-determining protein RodA [Planctomycetota bacterium]